LPFSAPQFDELADGVNLATLSNLCSRAKNLRVSRQADAVQVASAAGTVAWVLNSGVRLGRVRPQLLLSWPLLQCCCLITASPGNYYLCKQAT